MSDQSSSSAGPKKRSGDGAGRPVSFMSEHIFGKAADGETAVERRAAYVVIVRGASVAVVNHGQSYFLPGGGFEPGESARETVIRETEEEVGRRVIVDQEIGEAVQYFYSSDDQVKYKMTTTFFTGRFVEPTGNEVIWLSGEELQRLFHECHRWAVQEAAQLSTER